MEPRHSPNGMIQETMVRVGSVERQFMDVIPDKYKAAARILYNDWLSSQRFTNATEKNRARLAYMHAFVAALHLTMKDDTDAGHINVPGDELPKEEPVLPIQGSTE